MQLTEPGHLVESTIKAAVKTLMIVGPQPPPVGGSPLTVQAIIDELAGYTFYRAVLINTSPSRDPRKKMTGFNAEKVQRMIFILRKYVREIRRSDAILVFSNNLFILTIVPLLLMLAQLFHKPFFIKPVGGDLDLYIAEREKLVREYILRILRAADGVLCQTQLLQAALIKSGCTNAHYLPGFRPLCRTPKRHTSNSEEIRLIYFAHITRNKGPLVLLEALQLLGQGNSLRLKCDFYGPIHDEILEDFSLQLLATPNARYQGVAEAGTGTRTMTAYDVLVVPTYFACEGHPGVIIEAMQAGIPVISTLHRAIPELVTNGENGLLVPTQDSHALAEAIMKIALDRPMRERMGRANFQRGQEFRADVVAAQMLEMVFAE